jgi:membrane protease YdiL (CAAX protease family)
MKHERLWPLALFLVLVLPLSWYGFLIRGSSASDSGLNPLGPLVAALIVTAVSGQFREYIKRIVRVRAAPSTYAIALGLPILLCLLAVGTAVMVTGTPFPLEQAAARKVEFVDAFLVGLLFVALGEEPGWRGYLLPAMSDRVGPVMATLAICPIWAIWHYPLMGPQLPLDLLPQFLISLVGGAFVLSWLTLRTKGGVLPAMLCHGMINGIGANYLYRLFEGDALTIIWWTSSFLWLVVGIAAAFAMQREYRASQGDVSMAPAPA